MTNKYVEVLNVNNNYRRELVDLSNIGDGGAGGTTVVVIETNSGFSEVVNTTHTAEEIRELYAQDVPMFFVIKVPGTYEGMPSEVYNKTEYFGQVNTNGTVANGPAIKFSGFSSHSGKTLSITVQYNGFLLSVS